jgi:hypothetical protein
MYPVQAIGVCHDQNGSTFASIRISDAAMMATPSQPYKGNTVNYTTPNDQLHKVSTSN